MWYSVTSGTHSNENTWQILFIGVDVNDCSGSTRAARKLSVNLYFRY